MTNEDDILVKINCPHRWLTYQLLQESLFLLTICEHPGTATEPICYDHES